MISEKLKRARDYEQANAKNINSDERPAYHISTYVGWMNDPNGFSYYKNKYHLFYQYHPYGLNWGPMHWGHVTSEDLIHWEYLPCAIAPDAEYDDFGCFSGSAVEMPDGKHLLMYTGVIEKELENGSKDVKQVQCIAFGDGTNYEKYENNPVLTAKDLPEGGSVIDFRDPKIWQEADGSYACIVGNRTDDGSGALLIYRSDDCINWHFDTILDKCNNEYGKMWECPDYFELDGKKVILTSPQDMQKDGYEFHNGNGTLCLIGSYDENLKKFKRENIQAIDYGIDFYAPQTILAPDGRRIMIAWMQNWDACHVPTTNPKWFGQMTVARELNIKNGRLIQNPVRELESVRTNKVYYNNVISGETKLDGICGRIMDLTLNITACEDKLYDNFEIKVASGHKFFTSISYNPKNSILSIDRSNSGTCRDAVHDRKCKVADKNGQIKLRVLLDRFSVEIFVNDGEQALSTTIYTPQTDNNIVFDVIGTANVEVEKYDLNM